MTNKKNYDDIYWDNKVCPHCKTKDNKITKVRHKASFFSLEEGRINYYECQACGKKFNEYGTIDLIPRAEVERLFKNFVKGEITLGEYKNKLEKYIPFILFLKPELKDFNVKNLK